MSLPATHVLRGLSPELSPGEHQHALGTRPEQRASAAAGDARQRHNKRPQPQEDTRGPDMRCQQGGRKGIGLESGYSPTWAAGSAGNTGLARGVQGLPPQPRRPRAQKGHVLTDGSPKRLLLTAPGLGHVRGLAPAQGCRRGLLAEPQLPPPQLPEKPRRLDPAMLEQAGPRSRRCQPCTLGPGPQLPGVCRRLVMQPSAAC